MPPRSQGDVNVTLSVLDRLIDRAPKVRLDAHMSRAQSVRMLKAAVHRDLEWLLNTRRNFQEPDESLEELRHSLYVYGLPDFSSYSMASPADQAKLLRQLLATIRMFEPRLGNLQITPLEVPSAGLQRVRLRIEAMLLMDPRPEPVSFDTVIELRSGICQVTGGADAR
jgi:type VI secretion system protein ImpF